MKVDQEDNIEEMLKEAQSIIAEFDDLVSNVSEDDIGEYRDKISGAFSENDNKEIKKDSDKGEK
tara:strand:- start:4996 stop:5187 length:192 start_codon:yes stop_codon:yes gene_type:complete